MTDAQWALAPILALAIAVPLAAAYEHRARRRWQREQLQLAFYRLTAQVLAFQDAMKRIELAVRDFAIQVRPIGDAVDQMHRQFAASIVFGYRVRDPKTMRFPGSGA
jgi:hypothetical protein